MICSDFPKVNNKNGVDLNLKNGIHVFFPNLVLDRRKLIEIRNDALKICRYFVGASNDFDDIFDLAVYKANGLLLYGSKKPARTSYFISKA